MKSCESVPEYTSSTGPWSRIDQSGLTSMLSVPPGIRTVTRPWSHMPFLTAAQATALDEEPEASVHPAPRSQIRMSTWDREATRAHWTLMRLGNAG